MVRRMMLSSATLAVLLLMPALSAPKSVKSEKVKSGVAACCATKTRCCDKVEFCCDQPDKAECCLKGVACCDKEPCCGPVAGKKSAKSAAGKTVIAKKLVGKSAAKSCCASKAAKKS